MKLSGPQYQQLQRTLMSAFPKRAGLEQMVLFQLGEQLDAIAEGGNLSDLVFSLIRWAMAEGRLDDLIKGAQVENPGNPELRVFVEQLAQAQQSTEPAPASTISAQPTLGAPRLRRRDIYTPYELAMEQLLRRLGSQHSRYAEALTYQQRLNENVATSRRYGDTEATRAGRAQVVGQLNSLALDELGVSFNQLM